MVESFETEGKVGNRFTIVIPKRLREKIQLKEGESIIFRLENGRILIEPKRGNPFKKLDEIAGDIKFDRHTRQEAEKLAFKEAVTK